MRQSHALYISQVGKRGLPPPLRNSTYFFFSNLKLTLLRLRYPPLPLHRLAIGITRRLVDLYRGVELLQRFASPLLKLKDASHRFVRAKNEAAVRGRR